MSKHKSQAELINELADICEQLGWAIGVPADNESEMVNGLIVGTEDFIYHIIQAFDGEAVEVYSKDEGTGEISEPQLLEKKKIVH